MLRSLCSFLTWVVSVLWLATNCSAATFLSQGYTIRFWQIEDGLPQNYVSCATQTHDGYLWFGTNGGLARFDGERFHVFEPSNTPEFSDRRITALFEDADQTLWIGQETGRLTKYHGGRFEAVPVHSDGTDLILGLGSDEQKRMWMMQQSGVVTSLSDGARLPSLITPEHPSFMAWTRNDKGAIWLLENGTVAQLANGNVSPIIFASSPRNDFVNSVTPSADGGLWVLGDSRIRKWINHAWAEELGSFLWPSGTVSASLELQDGTLAVGTVQFGLYLYFRDGRPPAHIDHSNGLSQDWVRFLYQDREGTLWAGIGGAGVAAIHATAFSMLSSPDAWQGCSVLAVAPGLNKGLWIGTEGAALYHYSAGQWKHYGPDEGLANPYIWAMTETPGGDVWAGSHWWGGLHRLENYRFVRPEFVDPHLSPVVALMPDREPGGLLVGTRDGLQRLNNATLEWLIKGSEIGAADVSAIAQDRQGTIWCGFAQGGLARFAEGKVTVFHRNDGLGSDALQSLFCDTDGSLWIGTADHGLTRYTNGRFTNLGPDQGMADNAVCTIQDDGLGYFWFSTHHGLQRVAKAELNRCADGALPVFASQTFDHGDGLPVIDFNGGLHAAGCRTEDGQLWFASSKGVVGVDPTRIQRNVTPPPVVIESLLVDDQPLSVLNGAVLAHLSPDHQRLEFHFSGLSYVAPSKVHFRYRLEGIDEHWVNSGARRAAFYSRLRAGTYRFQVVACNNDGVWNNEGASLTFAVEPFFWETWWFFALCSVSAASAIALLARYITRRRLQRQIEELARQRELERERARIAQDIHDDVGTSLSRIAMLSQTARNARADPERTSAALLRIYDTAREITRALNEIVWAIDPRHDTLDSLVDYMGKFAQEFLATAHLRCRLDLPVSVPAWPLSAETRHNLFLAFKESLNNAVKHASASEVRISFRLQSDSFILAVRDNGPGFDPSRPSVAGPDRIVSGLGLAGMKARLARIGGRCDVETRISEGTSVSFIVNVPAARKITANPNPSTQQTAP